MLIWGTWRAAVVVGAGLGVRSLTACLGLSAVLFHLPLFDGQCVRMRPNFILRLPLRRIPQK